MNEYIRIRTELGRLRALPNEDMAYLTVICQNDEWVQFVISPAGYIPDWRGIQPEQQRLTDDEHFVTEQALSKLREFGWDGSQLRFETHESSSHESGPSAPPFESAQATSKLWELGWDGSPLRLETHEGSQSQTWQATAMLQMVRVIKERKIAVAVMDLTGGQWAVAAIETAAPLSDGNVTEDMESVFDQHAHDLIGTFGSLRDALDAGERYLEQVSDTEPPPDCACEEI